MALGCERRYVLTTLFALVRRPKVAAVLGTLLALSLGYKHAVEPFLKKRKEREEQGGRKEEHAEEEEEEEEEEELLIRSL